MPQNEVNAVTLKDLENDTRKPRIAFFLAHLSGGGVERRFLKLIKHLCDKGVVIDLILTECVGERLSDVPKSVRIVDLQSRNHRNQMLKNIRLFSKYLQLVRPAIVHSAIDKINVVAALGRWISGVDCRLVIAQVASVDLQEISWFKPTRILHYILLRVSFPLADAFITPSYGIANELQKLPFMGKKTITGIHNALICDFTPNDGEKKYVKSGIPTLIAAGRLSHEKDYPTMLKAFSLVVKDRDCQLYILGEGQDREKLENMVKELGIEEHVQMPGFVSNPIDYMQESDVFVLSSIKEGLPNVLLEALVAGAKVVSTDCKHGPIETLDNGKYGKLVPIKDPQALAKAISETLDEPSRTAEQEEDLQQHIAKFSYENHAKKYEDALGIFKDL